MKKRIIGVIVLSTLLGLAGCTTDPYTGESKASKTGISSAIGTVVGAGIGAISSSKKDRGKGALIGAAAGATLGAGVGYYMDQQEAKLREQLRSSGVSVTRSGDVIILNMPNNITFATNSAVLQPEGIQTLTSVALVLKEYDKTAVNVIGYTDSTGSDAINQRLSLERANSVSNVLIMQKISSSRIRVNGAGSSNPITSNETAEGRAQNRRVEIVLSPLQ